MAAALLSPRPLTPQQCREYEHHSVSIARQTAEQYAQQFGNEAVDTKLWKHVKRREGLQVYRSRELHQPKVPMFASSPGGAPHEPTSTPATVILCIGMLNGSIEDAMYGTVAPTEQATATRSTIIQDELIQHRVLQDIRLPTVDEPFRYVGLKWALCASKIAAIVKTRDVVYVEASGFQTISTPNGQQRIGYVMDHSVELPESTASRTKRAKRARFTMCTLFRQQAPGVVEMVSTLTSFPSGSLSRMLLVGAAANALLATSTAMDCAWKKKLARMYTTRDQDIDLKSRTAVAKIRGSDWFCLQCSQSISKFHALAACEICSATACSRCITAHKLVLAGKYKRPKLVSVDVCAQCVMTVRQLDATQIAIEEYTRDPSLSLGASFAKFGSTSSTVSSPDLPSVASSDASAQEDAQAEDPLAQTYFTFPEQAHYWGSSRRRRAHSDPEPCFILDSVEDSDSDLRDSDDDVELIEPMPVRELPGQRLLRRMHELRVQAEQTYFMMKHQSRPWPSSQTEADVRTRHASRSLSRSAPTTPCR